MPTLVQPPAPDWMEECDTCVQLVQDLSDAPTDPLPREEFDAVRNHVLEAHEKNIPDYRDSCPKCQEWKARFAHPVGTPAPRIEPDTAHQAKMHRAGHLLFTFTD